MPHQVFICYAARDKAVAEAVCAALESSDIKCWIAPRDILAGMEWAEAIVDALDGSRVLVLVLSSSSNTSPQVIREVERTASQGIPIIPLRIEDVTPSKAMSFFISRHQWLDALTPPLENHLPRLADTVQQILTRKGAPQKVIEIAGAEEKEKREAEEARKAKEAEERAGREAEEARRAKEVEERAEKEEEARKAKEAEERARREAEEAGRAKEAEEKVRREAAKTAQQVSYCPKCGIELRAKASFCHKCGTYVSEGEKAKEAEEKAKREAEEARKAKEAEEAAKAAQPVTYCPKCGIKLRPNTSFCHKCGARISRGEKAK